MLRKVLTLLLAVFLMAGAAAFAAPPDNYTGKMVIGGTGMSMEIAHMGEKTRTENPMMKGMVTISIPSAKKSIMMSIPGKSYFEQTMASGNEMPSVHDSNAVFEKKKVGDETIDGHPCVKSTAVFYMKDKPQDKHNATIWEASDLGGLIIRYEMKASEMKQPMPGSTNQTLVTEIKDIKVGAATAAMFEVPSDYKKAASMQELMMGSMGSFDPKNMPIPKKP
ncbi:MAG: DUF4412 domain-containing protein [Candidatus Magnetominusculus sp. LBB02]|nr:DUF4412 domain-containing protein [Candidatus Magnetominusculus sp. LBB02]